MHVTIFQHVLSFLFYRLDMSYVTIPPESTHWRYINHQP